LCLWCVSVAWRDKITLPLSQNVSTKKPGGYYLDFASSCHAFMASSALSKKKLGSPQDRQTHWNQSLLSIKNCSTVAVWPQKGQGKVISAMAQPLSYIHIPVSPSDSSSFTDTSSEWEVGMFLPTKFALMGSSA